MIILCIIIAWHALGIVAFAVYAAGAGEYWAARRLYTAMLRFALSGKNARPGYRLSLNRGNEEKKPVSWHAKSTREAGRRP